MKKVLFILSLSLAVVSCNKTQTGEETAGYGVLSMNVNLDGVTKAAFSADELLNNASVKIYKSNHKGMVRSFKYSEMPSPFYLASDMYRVDVLAGETVKETPQSASWEQKTYKGSKEFKITEGQVTNIDVEATISNAVSCISFDQTIQENFVEGYTFTIGIAGANSQLVYDAAKSGVEGYFIVDGLKSPKFEWTFSGTLAKDGSAFVKNGEIKDLLPGRLYNMNLRYTIKDGDLELSLMVDYSTDVFDDVVVFEPVSTGLASSSIFEIWAAHATLHAVVDPVENAGAEIKFEYSANQTDWIKVDGIDDNDGTFHAYIDGLTPSTEYTYRLLVNGEAKGSPRTFTTAEAPNVPNSSFEYVSLVSGKEYYKFYDPSCPVEEGQTKFWGSGNGEAGEPGGVAGSASMGPVITEIDTNDKVDGEKSVLAKNGSAMNMLTAGNIFTGDFAELIINIFGDSGGKVNFGRPWTSRPSGLKLWCKYTTGKMDVIKYMPDGVSLSSNDYDRAQIKFAIGTWTQSRYKGSRNAPVQVNTTDQSTFIDFYTDENTIANGDLIIYNDGVSVNKADKTPKTTSEWEEYYIPLDYRKLNEFPTHIIISCSAAQYGDYFTGCSTSKLWIDKLELIYE